MSSFRHTAIEKTLPVIRTSTFLTPRTLSGSPVTGPRRLALLALLTTMAGVAYASEPGNDTPSSPDILVATTDGGTFNLSLEERSVCGPCTDDDGGLTAFVGAFNASGSRLDSYTDYLYGIALPDARTFKVTGSNDTNFDGMNDANPVSGHGLLGLVEITVDYYDAVEDWIGSESFDATFASGSEVYSRAFSAPAGAVMADIEAPWTPADTGNCPGSDVDHLLITGLEGNATYTVHVFGLPEVLLAAFNVDWDEVESSMGSQPAVVTVVSDSLGRARLAVGSSLDWDFDGLDDASECPHELVGDYSVIVERHTPAPVCIAEYNGDGELDILDFLEFLQDFSECSLLPAPCGVIGNADVNGDTIVDILDLLDFMQVFGEGCDLPTVPAAPGSVSIVFPEPGLVRVNWNDLAWNEEYVSVTLEMDGDEVGTLVAIKNSTSADFELGSELVSGSGFYATVCAVNEAGEACAEGVADFVSSCPTAPSPLTWTYVRPGSVRLAWLDPCTSELKYHVARTIGSDPDFDNIAQLDANTTTHQVRGLSPGETHHYKVRGRLDGSYTPYSNTVSIPVPAAAPNAPTALRTDNLWSRTIDLRWNDNAAHELEVRVAMSTDGVNFNNVGVLPANGVTFRVDNLLPNTTYWFKVRVANLAGYSSYSNTLVVTTPNDPPTIPNAPANLRADETDPCSVLVRWDDLSNNEVNFFAAISKDNVNFNNAAIVGQNVTAVRLDNLCPETVYFAKVRAGNDAGYSAYSNTIAFATPKLHAPSALNAARDTGTPALDIVITWALTGDCRDGYRLARSTDGVNFINIATVGAGVSSYRDASGLVRDQRYYYKVRAYKDCDGQTFYSEYSNTESAIAR